MIAYKVLVPALILLLATAATPTTAPGYSATTQPKKGAGPKANAFKVQIRHPGWIKVPVGNASLARLRAYNLKRAGWTTQIKEPRPGVFVVRAKMARWQNRAVVTNRGVAEQLANVGRSQGFQARVVPFNR